MYSYDRRLAAKKKRISIDAVVRFKHLGRDITVRVERTEWNGPDKPMSYIWKDDNGKTYQTEGLPADLKVLSDVPAHLRK